MAKIEKKNESATVFRGINADGSFLHLYSDDVIDSCAVGTRQHKLVKIRYLPRNLVSKYAWKASLYMSPMGR